MTSLHPDERFALVTLRDTVDHLREHIDHRAAEIAAPRIAAVEEAAAARVAAAELERDQWQQRFEDIREELGRQLKGLERQRDRLRAELTATQHRGPESHGETRTHPTTSPDTRPTLNGAPRPTQQRTRPTPPRTSA